MWEQLTRSWPGVFRFPEVRWVRSSRAPPSCLTGFLYRGLVGKGGYSILLVRAILLPWQPVFAEMENVAPRLTPTSCDWRRGQLCEECVWPAGLVARWPGHQAMLCLWVSADPCHHGDRLTGRLHRVGVRPENNLHRPTAAEFLSQDCVPQTSGPLLSLCFLVLLSGINLEACFLGCKVGKVLLPSTFRMTLSFLRGAGRERPGPREAVWRDAWT